MQKVYSPEIGLDVLWSTMKVRRFCTPQLRAGPSSCRLERTAKGLGSPRPDAIQPAAQTRPAGARTGNTGTKTLNARSHHENGLACAHAADRSAHARQALAEAETLCLERGLRLTPIRRDVLA